MTDKYTEAAREMMEGTDYYETLDVIRQQDLVGRIASTLRSKDEEFDREVNMLRETVERRMRFDSMNPDQVMIAFDTTRRAQLSRKEGKE